MTAQLRLMTIIHQLMLMMRSPLPIHDWNCHLIAWKVSTMVQANGFDLPHCCVNISYPTLISLSVVLSLDLLSNREERSLGSRLIMEELITHV